MLRTKPCKYCSAPVMWLPGIHRPITPVAIPWMDDPRGVVFSRTRGVMDAWGAWPQPSEFYPFHRCPQYMDRAAA